MKRIITFLLLFLAATSLTAQTSCGTVKDYDGNTYTTVQIGKQCWMKQNLRTKHYANGESIPSGGSSMSESSPYYYDYSNSGIPLEERGHLYNWPAAMHGASSSNTNPSHVQGICPNGWHLPSDAEWRQLTDYVSSQSKYVCEENNRFIAKALAATTGWSSSTSTCNVGNNQTSNNATGFSAVPAGRCGYGSSFKHAGYNASFWSATQNGSEHATYRVLYHGSALMYRYDELKNYGYSVRCLRDDVSGKDKSKSAAVIDSKPCPNTPRVIDYDGNVYTTVQIGKQCWMKQNLRTKHYANGESIPSGGSSISNSSPYYYDYSNSGIPLEERGYLYNWPAAMHGASSSNTNPSHVQGICPNGWHLPSDAEWTQLKYYVGSQSKYACKYAEEDYLIAKALADTTGWRGFNVTCCVGCNQSSNNATGFSAVPAGWFRRTTIDYFSTSFYSAGSFTSFWSSSQYYDMTSEACYRSLAMSSALLEWSYISKCSGMSVRCLRD